MARRKIKSATDQRKFTMIYNDFLESDVLNHYEKLIFIVLKKFANNDTLKAFPSLKTIHKVTGISLSQVRRSIEHMEELGVLSVEHRIDDTKGNQSNLYTLYDYAGIWNAESSDEIKEFKSRNNVDLAAIPMDDLLAEIERRKKEVPEKQHTVQSSSYSSTSKPVDTVTQMIEPCQDQISQEQIRGMYEYKIMLIDHPELQVEIDAVMRILEDALNTQNQNIRIGGEDKPAGVVKAELQKITREEIIYIIQKFREQTTKIKNTDGYLLTMLFRSRSQMQLEMLNDLNQIYGEKK